MDTPNGQPRDAAAAQAQTPDPPPRDASTDAAVADVVRADPGSRGDLEQRSRRLPPGHPSSPLREDGSARPPEPRLRDIAPDVRPLTDQEHADHVREIRSLLEKAHTDGQATDERFTTDPDQEQWTAARDRIQGDLVTALYEHAREVPCEHHAIVAGGLGGAGKTTVLEQHAGIDRSRYLTINPDDIKEKMASRNMIPNVPGLSPMEASDLAHEESSYIAKQLAYRAQADGKNIIWDITMSSRAKTEQRIDELRSAGYTDIEGIFVDISVETSVARADKRHRDGHDEYRSGAGLGGRFVPAEVITGQVDADWGSANRKTFEEVKHRFDAWSRYDNSVDGRAPVLVETSHREEASS